MASKDLWVALLIFGVLFLILSLFLSLYWKVFNLIDELSGRKAKRQIAKLREYNNSTGEITSVRTEEMELMMSGDAFIESTTSEPKTTTRSLRDMIDDPYGSVGKEPIVSFTEEPEKVDNEESELPTGLLYESKLEEVDNDESELPTGLLYEEGTGNFQKQCIVILDEQSSI